MAAFPEDLLARLSEHLNTQMGWNYPPDRWRDLQSGVTAAARELGIADATAYAYDLLARRLSRQQIEVLAGALTIGETYFFRDPRSFEILEQDVFPELIRARRQHDRRLRIWSAGCCTGEEIYSIAILLDRLLPDRSDWQITLLATDINTHFLERAAAGIFGEWSFRGAPPWLKERYFRPAGHRRFAIAPRIKSAVTFAYLNLGEDTYPSLANSTNAMDLVLCRNVLMYFSAERAGQAIRNFHQSLVSNGLFALAAVETSPQLAELFVPAPFDGAVFYRKKSESDIAAQSVPQPEPVFVPPPIVTVATPPPLELPVEATPVAAESEFVNATLLARIHANRGDLVTARSWAEQAIAADRTDALAYYLLAVILQEQDEDAAAVATLQKTLYLQPQFVMAHFALGNLEQRQGRAEAAARHFNNALELLDKLDGDDVLPHSDGMVAGRLQAMIRSMESAHAT